MENAGRTLVCSVLFLDIVEYSKTSVADQIVLKQTFNRTLTRALEGVAARDRIVLDTGDGAAIAFLGDPEDALFAALSIRENSDLPVRMGMNLGPVRLVKDINGQSNIIGDGINVAQRVMSFAEPGQLLVSRSYYEVAYRLSNDYTNLFTHAGARADKHVREHEVYSVGAGLDQTSRASVASKLAGQRRGAGTPNGSSPHATASLHDENEPARVFDAGANLIISGYSKSRVEEALNKLILEGSRIISPPTRVNEKWMATCEHAKAIENACKVVTIEGKQIVTGPMREAVALKVQELVHFGSRQISEITLTHGIWTAVCQSGDG